MDLPEMSAASNVFVKACVVVRFSLFKINQKHSDLSVQPRARTNWLRSQHRSRHKSIRFDHTIIIRFPVLILKDLRKSRAGCSSAVDYAPGHGTLFPSAHMAVRFLNSKGGELGESASAQLQSSPEGQRT